MGSQVASSDYERGLFGVRVWWKRQGGTQRPLGVGGRDVVDTGRGGRGRGLITAGGMRAMIVVVVHPDLHGLPTGLLGVIGLRVEDLIDQQTLVALDLAVVPRRVRADALMSSCQSLHRAGEGRCTVVVPVVRDHSLDLADPVGSEEDPCPGEEPDRGGSALISQGLGVGQARVPIER